jgi:hypothetical protein
VIIHRSGTLTDIILCGGVGAQPITTPVAGQPPEEITLERALSDFLSCYYPSPLMIMIQSSPLPTTHVIMLFERFTIGCALSRFSPGSPPARLILGVPLLGSPRAITTPLLCHHRQTIVRVTSLCNERSAFVVLLETLTCHTPQKRAFYRPTPPLVPFFWPPRAALHVPLSTRAACAVLVASELLAAATPLEQVATERWFLGSKHADRRSAAGAPVLRCTRVPP